MLDTARDPIAFTVSACDASGRTPSTCRARSSWRSSSGLPPVVRWQAVTNGSCASAPRRSRTSSAVASGASGPGCTCTVAVVLGQLGEQWLVVMRLTGAQGRGDEHRQSLQPAQQEGQRAKRAGVAPLHVVDGQHHGLLLGQVDGQPVQAVQHRERPVGPLGRVGGGDVAEHRGCRRGRPAQQLDAPRRVGEGGLEQLADSAEPERALQLAAPGGQHQGALRLGQAPHLLQQPALPDAGRAVDQGQPALTIDGVGQGATQHAQLAVAPDHQVGCCRPWVAAAGPRAGYAGRGLPLEHCARRGVQRRRLGEHLALQRAQSRARVDAQLVSQRRAGTAQRSQRVRLPVGPVEREHQQPPAFLAQRVLGDESLDLGHQHGGLALAEPCLEQLLAGDLTQAGQPGDLAVGPALAGVVGVRRAPPEPQRLLELPLRGGRVALPACRSRCSKRQASTESSPTRSA